MAEDAAAAELPAPQVVEYDPVTGVPSEFNEYLPKDCEEFKRWKANAAAALEGALLNNGRRGCGGDA